MTTENFRNPIGEDEKSPLLQTMSRDKNLVIQIDSPVGKIPLQIQGLYGEKLLVSPRTPSVEDLKGKFKIQFVFDRARFECQVDVEPGTSGNYYLQFNEPIFKIQRRQNFRTDIPENWSNKILIDKVNQRTENLNGKIRDLSLTGCFFETTVPQHLQEKDSLEGEINIGDFKPVRFTALILRVVTATGKKGYGLHFENIEGFGKETLNTITVQAARHNRDYTKD